MKGWLIIPVEYKGEQLELKGKLLQGKFGFLFKVKVDGGEVLIEPDKEGNYKVAVRPAKLVREGKVDMVLMEMIKMTVEDKLES